MINSAVAVTLMTHRKYIRHYRQAPFKAPARAHAATVASPRGPSRRLILR
jgi:hypothetical protein